MKKTHFKKIDALVLLIVIAIISVIVIFTLTRQAANQETILMEIYKLAGPNSSTASPNHYYIYENSTNIEIRETNLFTRKEIDQTLIDNLKNSLETYIEQKPILNTDFNMNERYVIEYNGTTVVVPNPQVVNTLGHDGSQFTFYNTVENFINTIK